MLMIAMVEEIIGLVPFFRAIEAADSKLAHRRGDPERAAAASAMNGRQIARSPLGRESIEHRSGELQERRLAGLIGTVEDVQTGRQLADFQPTPHAKAIDLEIGEIHRDDSFISASGCKRSAPSSAACRKIE